MQPSHGIFVMQRLKQLLESGLVDAKVVAPIPYVPDWIQVPRKYARYRGIESTEVIRDVQVFHPRYPIVPKVGMSIAPALLAASTIELVRNIRRNDYAFDIIDAHYFYPDGVAAAYIARRLKIPLVITARGTDINLIPRYRIPRLQILWAADNADAIITVCDALRQRLIELGVPPEKVRTLRNGVDPKIFYPADRLEARRKLDLQRMTLLSVGHLIERKGHHLTIEALTLLPDVELILIGAGPEEQKLRSLAASLGVADRVRFAGEIAQGGLREYYTACDATVLASSREGMANVLLESLACGCPVVATDVWGNPEVISKPAAGTLIQDRSAAGIAGGVRRLFASPPGRTETLAHSHQFHWHSTTVGQLEIFNELLQTRR